MAQLSIAGDASGSITLAAPAVSGTTTLTLPTTTGTILTDTTVTGTAKAWAYYSLTGAAVTINKSYNVSSITYSSVGTFIVNFVTSMTDANYTFVGSAWSPAIAPGIMGMNGTATTSSCPVTNSTISSSPVVANYVLQSVAFIGN